MNISKSILYKLLGVIAIVLLVIGVIASFFYSSTLTKIRYENLRGLATALAVYRYDNNDMLPDLNQWCDKLIAEADCSQKSFLGIVDSQKGVCGYALNKNLEGLTFSELPDKMVLLFEAKGPWNLNGGPELAKKCKHKGIAVIFVDGCVDFVKKENIDTLQWNP